MSKKANIKKRRTYWIVDMVTQRHRERALQLNQHGYDVHFFTTLGALISEIQIQRAGIILVSDSGEEQKVIGTVMKLINLPEISGARLLLIVDRGLPSVLSLAAAGNFRDIIPFDIEESNWVNRITFASAGRGVDFPIPVGQLKVNSIAALRIPARIVWISPRRVWIESRIHAPVGSVLSIEGGFAAALGLEAVSITVEENVRKNLLYRFSDATVASWNVPAASAAHALEALSKLKQQNTGPRCRVFIAVQNQPLRNKLIGTFEHPKFEVGAALQKQSLVHDPRYFNPHVVLIEDSVARDNETTLDEMIIGLSHHSAVMIIGQYSGLESLRVRHPGRLITVTKNLPRTLPELFLRRFAPVLSTAAEGVDSDAIYLLAEQQMSFAEISLPARLIGLHTMAGEVAAPVSIGNFALAQLDSPLLRRQIGRSPWVKFVSVRQETQPGASHLTCSGEFFFADLLATDRAKVGDLMIETLRDSLGRFAQSNDHKSAQIGTLPQSKFPASVSTNKAGALLPFNPPVPQQRVQSVATAKVSVSATGSAATVAFKHDVMPVSQPTPAPAYSTATRIQADSKPESNFLARMRPNYAEVEEPDDREAQLRIKRQIHNAREIRRKQTIALFFALVFIMALIWTIKATHSAETLDSGKVWSDSFKAFQEKEGNVK